MLAWKNCISCPLSLHSSTKPNKYIHNVYIGIEFVTFRGYTLFIAKKQYRVINYIYPRKQWVVTATIGELK